MIRLVRWFLVLYAAVGVSLPASLPNGCTMQEIRFKKDEVLLHSAHNHAAQLYLLHNNSQELLWLNHEKWSPDLSAGWGSSLKANHWSVLMVSQPGFQLTCARLHGDSLQNVNCERVLEMCRQLAFQSADLSTENATYWVAENLNYSALLDALSARGITLQP